MQATSYRVHGNAIRDSSGESRSVLLVEDDLDQASLVEDLLTALGPYRVELGHEERLSGAVARLRKRSFDLVLLDLNLPDCRGLAAVREIRAVAGAAPIIVLTNMHDEELALETLREGAEDYLIKMELSAPLLQRAMRYAMERARTEAALRESEERYALAMAGANDGLWDWNLVTDDLYVSPQWRQIVGYEEADAPTPASWFTKLHPDELESFKSALDAHLTDRTPHLECDHRIHVGGGEYRWVLTRGLAVRDDAGRPYRIAGSVTDISRRKAAEERLIHDALHDALTGLPNRSLFLNRLGHSMRVFERDRKSRFAVMFFDLDRFKTINDGLGHAVGDELLIGVGERLDKFLRPGDTVARLGGDEFAVLLSDIRDNVNIANVAERVHELLSEVFLIRGHEIHASASIGVALSSENYTRAEEMLRDADLAMYRAKRTAGASFEIFDQLMHESIVSLHRLEMDLRGAVEREEFVNHYQTIVSLRTGKVLGFEALLRWKHPRWGLMTPESFIDVAEETGLVVPIGWTVLRHACLQLRRWQEMFPIDSPLTMSVNVSGKAFLKRNFADRVAQILEQSALPPGTLRLEITEKAVMSHADEVLQALERLREMDVLLDIDDFGTGYSSLSYLQRFSYDSLKIDRSFVGEMESSSDASATVKAIVALAGSLQMNVIAEGVETDAQMQMLRDMQCPEAQGYRFSYPMDATNMSRLLNGSLTVLA